MNFALDGFVLRRPEPRDTDALYQYKNDPEIRSLLGGFSNGYSTADLQDWVEHYRRPANAVLWTIATQAEDRCVGHVGLYQIDHRVRSAEFGIMIGDRSVWGRGLGKGYTRIALAYGFDELNLNRIWLHVLSTNRRAIELYCSLGFKKEGVLRQAQYKGGEYIDVVVMSQLQCEAVPRR